MGRGLQQQMGKEHEGLYTGQVGNIFQPSKTQPTGLCYLRRCHLRAQSKISSGCAKSSHLSPRFLYGQVAVGGRAEGFCQLHR